MHTCNVSEVISKILQLIGDEQKWNSEQWAIFGGRGRV